MPPPKDIANRLVTQRIELLSTHPRSSRAQAQRLLGLNTDHTFEMFLANARLIPWVEIDETAEGVLIRVNAQLRQLCDGLRPRPSLPDGISIFDFLRDLRDQITQRRKANHDDRQKRRWNPDEINKRFQTELLDWIESQLDQFDVFLSPRKAPIKGRGAHHRGHNPQEGK